MLTAARTDQLHTLIVTATDYMHRMTTHTFLNYGNEFYTAADALEFFLIKASLGTVDLSDPDYNDYMLMIAATDRATEKTITAAIEDDPDFKWVLADRFMSRVADFTNYLNEIAGESLYDLASDVSTNKRDRKLARDGADHPALAASWRRVTNAINNA